MGVEVAVGAAVVMGAYQIYQNEKQAGIARRAQTTLDAKQKDAESELKNKQLNEQALEGSKARRAKQGGQTSYMGKGGTVLTSPQGIPSSGGLSSGPKTVLGQ